MNDGPTLTEYLEARFSELDKRLDERAAAQKLAVEAALLAAEKAVVAALAAAEKAVDKSEAAQKTVNASQNEFRGAQKDIVATMMPRRETENLIRELRGQIDDLKATSNTREGNETGRGSQSTLLISLAALGVAGVGVLYTVTQ